MARRATYTRAEGGRLAELEQAVRDWTAWQSIVEEKEQLNLDAVQSRLADTNVQKADETIQTRIGETYCHLLIPTQEGTKPIEWTRVRLQGQESIVVRASKKMHNEGHLITEWSAALLRHELERLLWKDQPHIGIKQLWEYLCKYIYLPRLRDEAVLLNAIRQGVGSTTWKDFFAFALSYDEGKGRYLGLVAGQIPQVILDNLCVLVKPEIAETQLAQESKPKVEVVTPPGGGELPVTLPAKEGKDVTPPPPPPPAKLTRFHGTVVLDPTRIGRDVGQIAEEVIAHLAVLGDAQVDIVLEIEVRAPKGIPEQTVRTVSENCNTLKFKGHEFEEG